MIRNIVATEDGSHTIEVPSLKTNYHSTHGAWQESLHVFIRAGLEHFIENNKTKKSVSVFEMGFGTGLNALLTLAYLSGKKIAVYYKTIELFPLQENEYERLNYAKFINQNLQDEFDILHRSGWGKDIGINKFFTLHKSEISLLETEWRQAFDVVYFDAFDPNIQPELWTEDVFRKIYNSMNPNGVFVTYSSKGNVRRALISAGFSVEKIHGPKGKREILRATKH